jgi:hypothetical protein
MSVLLVKGTVVSLGSGRRHGNPSAEKTFLQKSNKQRTLPA